jgi:hypothetical protein
MIRPRVHSNSSENEYEAARKVAVFEARVVARCLALLDEVVHTAI